MGWSGVKGCPRSFLFSSFSTVSLQSSVPCKSSCFAFYSHLVHGPRTFTWSLLSATAATVWWVTVQITDINTALCHSTSYGHHCNPQQHHRPRMSTWPLVQRGPWKPIWSLVAANPKNISMASGDCTEQGNLHGFHWKHGPRISTAPFLISKEPWTMLLSVVLGDIEGHLGIIDVILGQFTFGQSW